jgi:hypothetical protein
MAAPTDSSTRELAVISSAERSIRSRRGSGRESIRLSRFLSCMRARRVL